MKLSTAVFLGTLLVFSVVSKASSITEEEKIGRKFCQQKNFKEADQYLTRLANKALQEYTKVINNSKGIDPEYYYEVVHVGINDHCEKKSLVKALVKKQKSDMDRYENDENCQNQYNLSFRKYFILTLDPSEN
jgi:hypothetical protein